MLSFTVDVEVSSRPIVRQSAQRSWHQAFLRDAIETALVYKSFYGNRLEYLMHDVFTPMVLALKEVLDGTFDGAKIAVWSSVKATLLMFEEFETALNPSENAALSWAASPLNNPQLLVYMGPPTVLVEASWHLVSLMARPKATWSGVPTNEVCF